MMPQLAEIVTALDAVSAKVRRLAALSAAFAERPAPEKWSAAECVAHLSLTTKAYLPMMDAALASPAVGTVPSEHRYRADLLGRMLAWFLAPPFRAKTKTPPPFVPGALGPPADVVAEFDALQQALIARVGQCSGRALEGMRLVSPFNARVTYNMYSALLILVAHERRHLWQAEQALGPGAGA